ncbi:MAG: hypothetical protein K2X38_20570 [Gemmataceae bacterium]|nr:hypothetical protein [Gemmataceae bacterium]
MSAAAAAPRFLVVPENQSAFQAAQDWLDRIAADAPLQPSLLFVHGPIGSGKSLLARSVVRDLGKRRPGAVIVQQSASDWNRPSDKTAVQRSRFDASWVGFRDRAAAADLLIVEDVQYLPLRAADAFAGLLDERDAEERGTILTANVGPRHLNYRGEAYPLRFISRLAGGLSVSLEPMQAESRRFFLEELAQRRQLAAPSDILDWLAENMTGGCRQLEGAIAQLEALNKVARSPLKKSAILEHFRTQAEANRPTVDRIAEQVSGYFKIDVDDLRSRRRWRSILLPRQISMFLARKLTPMTLKQIGGFFGDCDHTTVMHACKKVQQAMTEDAALSGAVRQIETELA